MSRPPGAWLFRKGEWVVRDAPLKEAKEFIRQYHYAKGGSHTACYMHGLYHRDYDGLWGVAQWLPPTRNACESVNKEQWTKVLSLSRLAIVPGVPTNAASFLLSASVRLIRRDGRFVSLVTYADESQGHTGLIYRAANWDYVGRTALTTRWLAEDGRQVSVLSTKSRSVEQMKALGHVKQGNFCKHKFVLHLKGK